MSVSAILTLVSWLLIPLSAFSLSRGADPFCTSFSSLCAVPARRPEFLLWCAFTGGYFFWLLTVLFPRTEKQSARLLPDLCLLLLLWAALLPYRPREDPLCARLHVLCALGSALCLLICLYRLAFRLYFRSPRQGRRPLLILNASLLFCALTWIATGIINAAMEICLVCTASVQLRYFTRVQRGI